MDTTTIHLSKTTHEVPTRPITLIVPSASTLERISYDERIVELTAEVTTYHAQRCSRKGWHHDTLPLLEYVFGNVTLRGSEDAPLRSQGSGITHAAGLLDLTLKFQDQGITVAWKYPETSLHPAAAVQLGDVAVYLHHRHLNKLGLRRPYWPRPLKRT